MNSRFCTTLLYRTHFDDRLREGEKITAALRLPMENRREIAERLVDAYCKQIFEDGVYHADPHPGNIRLTPDGEVVLLDSEDGRAYLKQGIVALLQAVLSKNTEKIQRALGDMGFLNRHASRKCSNKLSECCTRLQSYFHVETLNLQELRDPQILFDTLTELRRMNVGVFRWGIPSTSRRNGFCLERTSASHWTVHRLDPTIQPMELLKPYLEKMLARIRTITQFALETLRRSVFKL